MDTFPFVFLVGVIIQLGPSHINPHYFRIPHIEEPVSGKISRLQHEVSFRNMFINDRIVERRMAHGLKRTSPDFFVSASLTESALNTFTTTEISLPLNSLDREVFVITGIILDPATPSSVAAAQTTSAMTLSRQEPTAIVGIGSFNTIALSADSIQGGVTEFDFFSKTYGNQITDTGHDHVDVVATPNMFLAVQGTNNLSPLNSQCRVFGYRAQAETGVYSALITSELNAS